MAADILRKGTFAVASQWQTLAAGAVHTVVVTGDYGAALTVEAKVGAGDDDAQTIGSVSASGRAMIQLTGPLTYRVRRAESVVAAGCAVEGDGTVPQPPDPTPPTNTTAPAVTGNARVGQTLTSSTGAWSGTAPISYAYQWLRAGNLINGATSATYAVVDADIGAALSCRVTASNSQGSAVATSNATAAVTKAPVNTTAPSITGTARAGQTLTGSAGAWSGSPAPTYTYRWMRDGVAIASATAATYALVAADVGAVITFEVTATNSAGSAVATSVGTASVAGTAPANTVLPTISGSAVAGSTLTGANGTWTGTPAPTFTRRWLRNGTAIAGATASTYALVQADIGATITFEVTGTNSAGNAVATSAATSAVAALPPTNTAVPTVTGTTTVGQVQTGVVGTWSGIPSPTYTQKWQRSADGTSGWTDIAGATALTYTAVAADIGQHLRMVVSASNSGGSASANSAARGPIAGIAPANTAVPVVSGTATVGQALSVTNGTWTGTPAPTYAYKWQTSADGSDGWADIAGATAASYTLVAGDAGQTIRAVVTATNSAGAVSANAAGVGPVAEA